MNSQAALGLLLSRCHSRFSLVDVGARGGVSERWTRMGDISNILCFEPDVAECGRLNTTCKSNVHYLPLGLSHAEAERNLYVTSEPACSSLHRPLSALHEHYPPLAIIKPQSIVRIPCRRLDDVLYGQGINNVAAIKLDTQGSELEILQGATKTLEMCSLIDIEVEFNQIYEGQGLFCDVDRFLRDHGFVLWRIENLAHYAPEAVAAASTRFVIAAEPSLATATSVANGQLFWAQAQYVPATYPRTGADYLPPELTCV